MDIICEACGVANKPGTEFCLSCGAYLAWDRSVLVAPRTQPAPAPQPVAPPPPVAAPPPPPAEPYRPGVAAPAPPTQPPPPPPPQAQPAPQPMPQLPPLAPQSAYAPTQPQPAVASGACPACGRINDPSLRFCAKCGQLLGNSAPESGARGTQPSRWSQLSQTRDRAARRAYRRSLPLFYRWRRVLIGLLVVALGLVGLQGLGRHPVRWTIERFYDLRNTTVILTGVQAEVDPPEATAPESTPAALVDLNQAAWTMSWKPAEQGVSCGGAPGTGVIVLTVPRNRIRQIDLQAGLLADNAERPLQFRPQSIGVSFDGGACNSFPLEDKADWQSLKVDSLVPVSTIRIGVDTTYAAREDGQALLSITEILVKARPQR